MKSTVILFGTNTFTRHLIDWTRQDCEFWAWNEVGSLKDDRPDYWAKRIDTLIQIHATPIWRNRKNLNHTGHYDWLTRPHEYPIYMQEHYPDVPSSVKYPLDEIVKELLPNIWRDINLPGVPEEKRKTERVRHFTSSAAYALALAIYQGAKQIEIHGIEMSSDTEYVRQRDGVTFWMGVAVGRGVNVVIHSPLLINDKLYGYTGEVVIQKQEFEMSARKLDNMVEEKKVEFFEARGRSQAMLDALLKVTDHGTIVNEFLADMGKITDPKKAQERVNRFVAEFSQSQNNANKISQEFLKTLNIVNEGAIQYGQLTGRYMENSRYMAECDELIKAAGGEKALQAIMTGEVAEVTV